ncbi:unnamed protein product [Caenorhabditis nigoni]
MTTNETKFFIRGSYILLVDLESWYDNGFVTPEDEVQMFDGEEKQVCTIKDLIKNYGCRFPFRRGNDSLVVNDFGCRIKNENNSPDLTKYSKGQLLGQRSMTPKLDLNLSEDILTELGPMDLIDHPLLNVDNEPEEDRITGDAILKEFHKLRQTWVLRNWNSEYAKYFEFLDRGHKGNDLKMTQPICRICDLTPRYLPEHLFGSYHIENLRHHSVSLRSFEFWSRKLQECLEKCGKITGIGIRTYDYYVTRQIKVEEALKKEKKQKNEKVLPDYETGLPSYFRTQVLLGTMDIIDYPLLNVENEPEEDRITGDAIFLQFRKLTQTWVIQNWNSKYAEYFKHLDRGYKENGLKLTQPYCRICNKAPVCLLEHLFSYFHLRKMRTHSVSLRSFEFWSQKLQKCLEHCGKISGMNIHTYELNVEKVMKKEKMQKNEKVLSENEIVWPSYSRSQILAERSLNSKFQLNLPEDILIDLGTMELRHYPLLNADNEPEEDRITGDAILMEFKKLRQSWVAQNWNSKYAEYFEYLDRGYKGSGSKLTQPYCRICKKTPVCLLEHLFNGLHHRKLTTHSVSLRSFEFWSQKLQECLEKCGKLSGVSLYKSGQRGSGINKKQNKRNEKMLQYWLSLFDTDF